MAVPAGNSAFIFRSNTAVTAPSNVNPPTIDIIGTRVASNDSKLYLDGTLVDSEVGSDSGILVPFKPAFGGQATSNSSASNFCLFIETLSGFGSGLSSTDVSNLRARVNALRTALGR